MVALACTRTSAIETSRPPPLPLPTTAPKTSSAEATDAAVSHKQYLEMGIEKIAAPIRNSGVFVDVKSAFHGNPPGRSIHYWAL